MKRIIICCDGTWQSLKSNYPTNVVKIAQSVLPRDHSRRNQIVYYSPGVGTGGKPDRAIGGVTGKGLNQDIADAYLFLCLNWEAGDEIYLVGFSRGAYTARSLAGLIHHCGIVGRRHLPQVRAATRRYKRRLKPSGGQKIADFRVAHAQDDAEITALCCFDTVGALGIPDVISQLPVNARLNRKHQFHDTRLSPIIRNAFHAVAIDEHRKPFDLTPMEPCGERPDQVLEQVWFAGDHGCIGGGSEEKAPLSNIALTWMAGRMAALGLAFDPGLLPDDAQQNPLASWPAKSGLIRLAGSIRREVYGPETCLHPSVKTRWQSRSGYRPKNLRHFADHLDA